MLLALAGCAGQASEPSSTLGVATGDTVAPSSLVGEWVGQWSDGYNRYPAHMSIKSVQGNRVVGTMYLGGPQYPGFNRDYEFVATLAGNSLTIAHWPHWSPLEVGRDGTMKATIKAEQPMTVSLAKKK
jgi:hypothetical protein